MAPEVEEGRGKLRKSAGRSKHLLIRRNPNRETVPGHPGNPSPKTGPPGPGIGVRETTAGSETSQYREEKKSTRFPQ